jgi:uncharacterized membrane protein YfcA
MLSPFDLTLAILIMASGCAFQAAVGIGMALLVVPLLALVDTQLVPGPMLFAGTALTALTAYRDRAALETAKLKLALAGLALGTVMGAVALRIFNGPNLPKLLGALVLLAVLVSVVGRKFQPTKRLLLVGSIASGIMGTMVGIHGPPLALVFQNAEASQTRAMLGAFFTVGYMLAVVSLAVVGLFDAQKLLLGFALLPGAVIGYLAAPAVSQFIDSSVLRVGILAVSSISAVSLLLR